MKSINGLTVCLMNQKTVEISVNDCNQVTASEVLQEVYHHLKSEEERHLERDGRSDRNLNSYSEFAKLFSIWITSPYLELQLQSEHRPFSVLNNWDNYLRNHGPIEVVEDPELIAKDMPTLSVQRNVFCDQNIEKSIQTNNTGALWLLYSEAKTNVLEGRYPHEDPGIYEQLAAIQSAIELGAFDSKSHSIDYFRKNIFQYIPYNILRSSDGNKINQLFRTLSRGSQTLRLAQNIVQKYRQISEHIFEDNSCVYKLLKTYLEICWEMPSYGSAYFSAQIERPIKSKFDSLLSHFDLKVWVAINGNGLHIISKEKPELLLSIDYDDLIWAVGRPKSDDPNCIPCLIIEVPEEDNKTTNILQIFSRQYKLIEALIQSFIQHLKTAMNSSQTIDSNHFPSIESYDVPDGPATAESTFSYVSNPFRFKTSKPTLNRKKLSLAKFDKNSGHCVNKTGSWVHNQNHNNIVVNGTKV